MVKFRGAACPIFGGGILGNAPAVLCSLNGHKFEENARPFERRLHHKAVFKGYCVVMRTLPKEGGRIACIHSLFDRPLPLKRLIFRLFPEEERARACMRLFPHREDGITQKQGGGLGKAVLFIAELCSAPAACDMPARRKPADGIVLRIDLPLLGMRKHKGWQQRPPAGRDSAPPSPHDIARSRH